MGRIIMNEELKVFILVVLVIVGFFVLYSFSIDYQKTVCLENGGKWVSGIVAGEYSAFCIPK